MYKKNIQQRPGKLVIIAIALVLLTGALYMLNDQVLAQAADTCPEGGGWYKVDGINAQTFEYDAGSARVVVETCYKAGTVLVFDVIDPPQQVVLLISDVENPQGNAYQDISHASFRLQVASTPTDPVTPTPTDPVTPTPTPTDPVTPTPTPTDPVTPTPTPTDPVTPTPTPTGEQSLDLNLLAECLGESTARWTVSNDNAFAVSYTWTANNGENGTGVVQAGSEASFRTNDNASNILLSYVINQESMSVDAEVDRCEDPAPDRVAGAGGISLGSTLIPMIAVLTGLGLISGWSIVRNKKNTINK
jgi:hypothetical protein